MDENPHEENVITDKEKTRKFWCGIWEKDVKHNESADWIQKAAEEMQGNKAQNIEISPTKLKERICKMPNSKALGPDGVHDYWIKIFVLMQE